MVAIGGHMVRSDRQASNLFILMLDSYQSRHDNGTTQLEVY